MIHVTDQAKQYLEKYMTPDTKLELASDAVGSACSDEGVLSLKITKQPNPEATETIESNIGNFYTTKKQALLLDDDLTIDFKKNLQALELKGAHVGLITPRLLVIQDI